MLDGPIPSASVAVLWPRIEAIVARAIPYGDGRYAAEDVRERLLARDMQLWLCWRGTEPRAVLVTEIVHYPRSRRCNLFLCAGDGAVDWLSSLPLIEEWARHQGCDAIDCQGRSGWERVLPGYRKTHVCLKKELNHARR